MSRETLIEKANIEWHELKNSLPWAVVELVAGEYNHAWGTEYNGFLLFEARQPVIHLLDWWSSFKDKVQVVCRANTYHNCRRR